MGAFPSHPGEDSTMDEATMRQKFPNISDAEIERALEERRVLRLSLGLDAEGETKTRKARRGRNRMEIGGEDRSE
jgi:hypothetical protein